MALEGLANRFARNLGAAYLRVLWKGAVFEFSFHAIHTIALKFTIDKRPDLWYSCACYLEQTSLIHSFAFPLTLDLSSACRLFSQNTGGRVSPRQLRVLCACPSGARRVSALSFVSVFVLPFADLYALLYPPLDSTLAKVYQNKELQLPLE
jgi:hypothetical protein